MAKIQTANGRSGPHRERRCQTNSRRRLSAHQTANRSAGSTESIEERRGLAGSTQLLDTAFAERSFELFDQADTDLIEDLNEFGELTDLIVAF